MIYKQSFISSSNNKYGIFEGSFYCYKDFEWLVYEDCINLYKQYFLFSASLSAKTLRDFSRKDFKFKLIPIINSYYFT